MPTLCCHGPSIMNGPLPIGWSTYAGFDVGLPAVDGTGLNTVCEVRTYHAQFGSVSLTFSTAGSEASTPESEVAVPACISSKPSTSFMWYATSEAESFAATRSQPRLNDSE